MPPNLLPDGVWTSCSDFHNAYLMMWEALQSRVHDVGSVQQDAQHTC